MPTLESLYSNQTFNMAVDNTTPSQVTGVSYSVEQGQVILTWNAVTTNTDGSAISDLVGYRVYRKKDELDTFAQIAEVANTSYTDEAMKDGASYIYAVSAIDDEPTATEGELSEDLNAKTIPSVPTGLSSQPFDNMIKLEWSSVKDELDPELNENLNGYNVYRSETDGSGYVNIGSASADDLAFEDTSAINGTTYYYVITAFDNSL
jgi:uncharacterized protein